MISDELVIDIILSFFCHKKKYQTNLNRTSLNPPLHFTEHIG
ncbi:hypothetical protein A676_04098 [Salmonella enterica subsp. enterica serovar Enteritidis str. 2010K-0262]|uniref:Uncharacterized protein n=4 Tax=Salmonella enterica I TaxID=59201 RepID=M7S8D3_SALDU|nr:hypothetical protein SPAB_04680 [Salmonella enterica subsp. enterica serovar Paratyphi B str. SPB7]ACY90921.1 hypothetical protein STM14_4540 [Salmonella enterica subsp. enterica serovar Typhimurium str. 14028S]EMR54396.1 hypothetical protein A670_00308 [Salmonella enterica subsp. enterica serovar Dublin str. UC16]EPI67673.1 hypothetical protein A672_03803 [Salmonella enterica subsp. enterica serovar Enteritidis str. 08-1080]EPI68747.1 hypothetical protein A673_02733 [Salmonella enterica sub